MTESKAADTSTEDVRQKIQDPFTGVDYLVLAIIGAITGIALRLVVDGDAIAETLRAPFIAFILSFAAGSTLLWRRQLLLTRLVLVLAMAALLALLTWLSLTSSANASDAPLVFWIAIGGPLLGFLLTAFARASLRERTLFWPYKALWQSGASILADAIIAAAVGLAAIAFVALWGAAFKSFDMTWAAKITHSPSFLLPLGGAAAALAGGLARSNTRLGEAVRSILLIGCRIGLPLAALFSLVFALGIVGGGVANLEKVPLTPTGLLLALALASELIFNGVYQDGHEKPPRWLRLSTWLALAILPIYTLSAAAALWMRVQTYGLTPSRTIALIALTLTAVYTILLLAGLLSEFFAKKLPTWMPPVAKLNTAMALVWILTLVLIHTPVLDPIALSARNQEARLISGRVDAKDFDFGFLKFKLGKPGQAVLARLEAAGDPDILAGIARANAAENYWEYNRTDTDTGDNKPVPAPDNANEKKAFLHINALLAPTKMTMQNAVYFNYGELAYGHGEVGKTALDTIGQWVETFDPNESGTVRILKDQIGQGIIAARLAKTREGWDASAQAARTRVDVFSERVEQQSDLIRPLGRMAAEDRAMREYFEKYTRNHDALPSAKAMLTLMQTKAMIDEMDARHLARLKGFLNGEAWFDPDAIGRAAELDAWLIVLHANHDLDFQEQVLAAIEPRVFLGAFDGRRYARLYDKLARARGKAQRYGTQTLCEEGRWVADVTETPAEVGKRRASMGLPPLAEALAQQNARFGECHN
jgi:Family of unknown function (DUF6624)/Domain of unknown function (DUF4153)